MNTIVIHNALIVNEKVTFKGGVIIKGEYIESVFKGNMPNEYINCTIIDANEKWLIPGVIDDQVHFREPGLTHKGDIASESRAALAGGVTSYMEMPNTNPQATNLYELEKKYNRAAQTSLVNYSFYLGATNNNVNELQKMNPKEICGVKVFMGSSTGNMLVDNNEALTNIFKNAPSIITTHCEDETIIRNNIEKYHQKYGENMPICYHSEIRNAEACYKSSAKAIELATKYNARLHVLHLSSAKEMSLFKSGNIKDKMITGEVCIHHLWFEHADYKKLETKIKWNPAIKSAADRDALWEALLNNKIDVVATDHAPHTLDEKSNNYWKAPSGGPLVQHSLVAMLEFVEQGKISIESVVDKMCHASAELFRINKRGFIRSGYYADLVLVDKQKWIVSNENIEYKCKWSPFNGFRFSHKVDTVFVNGKIAYENNVVNNSVRGKRLQFN